MLACRVGDAAAVDDASCSPLFLQFSQTPMKVVGPEFPAACMRTLLLGKASRAVRLGDNAWIGIVYLLGALEIEVVEESRQERCERPRAAGS